MFANLYAKTRDTVEGARDVSETLWRDWPIMALGLVVRFKGSIPDDHPRIRDYEAREGKRLRREYLRRRWRGGRLQAERWYEDRLVELGTELSRRRTEIAREEFARTANRHKDDGGLLFVAEDCHQDGGG